MIDSAQIIEVGLRDGLQNVAQIIPLDVKLQYINWLIGAGLNRIQVTSFVNPVRVPQMADAEALSAALPKNTGVEFSGLVLNTRGLERLCAAGLDAVDMGLSASETHSLKNTGQGVTTKLDELCGTIDQARSAKIRVRAGIQCAFGCVYEGEIAPQKVVEMARVLLDQGIDELSLADSTGMANPWQMRRMLDLILPIAANTPIVLHLHDTRGLGLANLIAALECGVSRFDTAFGGLGGCPFIIGAAGNIATEDTLNLLDAAGIRTGIDRAKVACVSRDIAERFGCALPGKLYAL